MLGLFIIFVFQFFNPPILAQKFKIMTITLYLKKETILDDLKILTQIFNAQKPELVEPLSKFLRPLNVSMNKTDLMLSKQIEIHVTPEEFTLIYIFNKGSFLL